MDKRESLLVDIMLLQMERLKIFKNCLYNRNICRLRTADTDVYKIDKEKSNLAVIPFTIS